MELAPYELAEPLKKSQGRIGTSRVIYEGVDYLADIFADIRPLSSVLSTPETEGGTCRDRSDEVFAIVKNNERVQVVPADLQLDECLADSLSQETVDVRSEALSPDCILDRLPSTQGHELHALICEAEYVRFSLHQNTELRQFLWQFILANRDGDSQAALVATGSAIRKYVGLMDTASIGSLCQILEPGHNASPDVNLEITVAEMVYAKFLAHPPQNAEPEPKLAQQLANMVTDYLRPRFVNNIEAGYPTVAMLSLQALAVMLSEHWSSVLGPLNGSPEWFRDQLRRRLSRALDQWRAASAPNSDALSELIESIDVD